jgi:Leu/Phe-tRNA-protein transferase
MTDCDTPKLTKVVTVLKEDFRAKYQHLHDLGYLHNKIE